MSPLGLEGPGHPQYAGRSIGRGCSHGSFSSMGKADRRNSPRRSLDTARERRIRGPSSRRDGRVAHLSSRVVAEQSTFWVDGLLVHTVLHPPARPLGFVAWLDNQYAVATPRGVLRFGTVASGPQWFELDSVAIEHQ